MVNGRTDLRNQGLTEKGMMKGYRWLIEED